MKSRIQSRSCQCPITGKALSDNELGTTIAVWLQLFALTRYVIRTKNIFQPLWAISTALFIATMKQCDRIIAYLVWAESKTSNAWLADDYRVARMTIAAAKEDHPDPWAYAFWAYYGKHPDKAIPIFVALDAAREALLGPGLEANYIILPPKKPSESIHVAFPEEEAA